MTVGWFACFQGAVRWTGFVLRRVGCGDLSLGVAGTPLALLCNLLMSSPNSGGHHTLIALLVFLLWIYNIK